MTNENVSIDMLVKKVMEQLNDSTSNGSYGVFSDMDDAVNSAYIAQKELAKLSMSDREKIISTIRSICLSNVEMMAKETVLETKMGNYYDKVLKNKLAIEKTPGTECLVSDAYTGDNGLTLIEHSAYGVIGAITPTTNPTETIICNSIGMIAGGNSVVFSPHPSSKNISVKTVELINKALEKISAPKNIITTINAPSIEQANKMINHKLVTMLVATGGPAVVKSVLSSGKKAIGAGAGNPPVIVDDTANIEKASKDIILGCSFDNNLPCISEKEVFVLENVCDYLIFNMQANGAHLLTSKEEIDRLEKLIINNNSPNKAYIGKSASYILDALNIIHKDDVKVIILETDFSHDFVQHELMMPVLPIVRVKNIDIAIDLAIKAEHGFRHTAIMHSKNIDNLTRFGKEVQTTIFVKNAPSYAGIGVGGEGYATFTIAGPTGEGLTSAINFTRTRRCVLVDGFNIK